jgi:hypothetical protein
MPESTLSPSQGLAAALSTMLHLAGNEKLLFPRTPATRKYDLNKRSSEQTGIFEHIVFCLLAPKLFVLEFGLIAVNDQIKA